MESSKTVVIVDDDAEDTEFLTLAASRHFATENILSVNDPTRLIDFLRELSKTPDLIFIDNKMPKLTGTELLRRIKEVEQLKPVPVIVLSGTLAKSEQQELFDAGASEVLMKAFSMTELYTLVDGVIERWGK
jgi:CheY-like chemotaxis protein